MALTQPALAVTDEEFYTLQDQFYQLSEQVEENSTDSSSATRVGGYGELHYNNLSNGNGVNKKEIDLHRFVLFINHDFNDKIRFFSEVEIDCKHFKTCMLPVLFSGLRNRKQPLFL